jgi:hypothetical protein
MSPLAAAQRITSVALAAERQVRRQVEGCTAQQFIVAWRSIERAGLSNATSNASRIPLRLHRYRLVQVETTDVLTLPTNGAKYLPQEFQALSTDMTNENSGLLPESTAGLPGNTALIPDSR